MAYVKKAKLPPRNHNFEGTNSVSSYVENVFCLDGNPNDGWFSWRLKMNRKAPYDFFVTAPSTHGKRKFDSFKISAIQLQHLKDFFWRISNDNKVARSITISRVSVKIYSDRFIIRGTAYGHNIKISFILKRPDVIVEFYNGYHSSIKSFTGHSAAGKQAGDHVENIMKSWVKSGMIESWFTEDMKYFGPLEMMQQ